MKCSNCGKDIEENNHCYLNGKFFCSDECNIKHHNWDKIPAEIQALKELK